MSSSTTATTTELTQEVWDNLHANIPHVYEGYPEKRKKLAKVIHEIDSLIKAKKWPHWVAWQKWDFMRLPLTFCFTCQHPARLKPTVSPTGELKKLECTICDLIHFDSRYD